MLRIGLCVMTTQVKCHTQESQHGKNILSMYQNFDDITTYELHRNQIAIILK